MGIRVVFRLYHQLHGNKITNGKKERDREIKVACVYLLVYGAPNPDKTSAGPHPHI